MLFRSHQCVLILPNSLFFISLYLIGWLHFLILEKWSYVGDVLWGPAVQSLLVTRAVYSRGPHYVGCTGPSVVSG